MRIARYETVVADNLRELDKNVNQRIGGGWQPFGSPYITVSPPSMPVNEKDLLCQAMIMDEEEARKRIDGEVSDGEVSEVAPNLELSASS